MKYPTIMKDNINNQWNFYVWQKIFSINDFGPEGLDIIIERYLEDVLTMSKALDIDFELASDQLRERDCYPRPRFIEEGCDYDESSRIHCIAHKAETGFYKKHGLK